MSSCCCSLAGTAACKNCANNPFATGADGVMDVVSHLRKYVEPQTNADRIRAMTDEELAEWVAYNTSCETCPVKNATDYECHNTDCKTAWFSWLKSPVEVDNG